MELEKVKLELFEGQVEKLSENMKEKDEKLQQVSFKIRKQTNALAKLRN